MARDVDGIERTVMVCHGSDCKKGGAKKLDREARNCLKSLGAQKQTLLVRTLCTGLCKQGPIVSIQPCNTWITHATGKRVTKRLVAAFAR